MNWVKIAGSVLYYFRGLHQSNLVTGNRAGKIALPNSNRPLLDEANFQIPLTSI